MLEVVTGAVVAVAIAVRVMVLEDRLVDFSLWFINTQTYMMLPVIVCILAAEDDPGVLVTRVVLLGADELLD